jgi:hypothetical protein
MRPILLVLFLCAAVTRVSAESCIWAVTPNISAPDTRLDSDTGMCFNWSWSWQYVVHADHLHIGGTMSANAYRCVVSLGAAASGNGTYLIQRIRTCCHPQEDIEGDARNEFTARAELKDDNFAQAAGTKRIKGSKMSLDCHANGGVQATSSGGGGAGGTLTIPLFPHGPNTVIRWSTGGTVEQVFQASDSGTGGKSPETVTCQTGIDLTVSAGWLDDFAEAIVKNSRTEMKVYGTCDGCCGIVTIVLFVSEGY